MATSMGGSTGMRGATGSGPLKSTGYKQVQLNNYSPEQMQLFQQMFGQVGPDSYLAKLAGGDQSTFEQMEAPAWQNFSAAQGNIASRFSGMGMGARKSSGFQNYMGQMGSDFAQQLQSQRSNLQMNAIQQLSQMRHSLLGERPYENVLLPKQKNPFQEFAMALAPGIGQAGASLAGMYGMNKFGMLGSPLSNYSQQLQGGG